MSTNETHLENLNDIESNDTNNGILPKIVTKKDLSKKDDSLPTKIGLDGLPQVDLPDIPSTEKKHTEEKSTEGEKSTEEEEEQLPQGLGSFATIMNLLNSLIGAGILSIPSSFINSGLYVSLFLLFLMGLLAWIAAVMIMSLQHRAKASGFDDLVYRICGKTGSIIFSILNLIFLVCATLAYLILGGDMILSWFSLANYPIKGMWRAVLILVYALILPIPLTFPRSISFLSYFSTVSLGSIVFFVIVMVIKAFQHCLKNGMNSTVSYGRISIELFGSLSIFSASFALPAVIIPIIRPFTPSIRKRSLVSFIAIIIAMILCSITGITGYLIFGQSTDGNVLKSFADNDILIIIVRSAFFLVVSFAYPAISQSIMGSWSDIIFKQNNPALLKTWKRIIIIVINNGIPLVIAMFLSSAKPAIAIGGAIGGNIVNYTFPSIMWIIYSNHSWKAPKNLLCLLFALFGIATSIISTYYAILGAIDAFK